MSSVITNNEFDQKAFRDFLSSLPEEVKAQSSQASSLQTAASDVRELSVPDLEWALGELVKANGQILGRWEYPEIIGAHCRDSRGNRLILWQKK